ncbi:hypothetical protein Tco_1074615 [Tanacetum coccineum]
MLSSTRVKPSTSTSGLQPSGNTKKDKIQQTPSSTQKNKVEAHPKIVKSSLKIKNCFVEPKENANVQHFKLNENSKLLCVKCNGCMLSDNHDLCVLDFINDVNARTKSKSVKKRSKRKDQPEFPQPDSGLIVPVFKQGDDPIDVINHMMSCLSAIVTSCYPTTNNQVSKLVAENEHLKQTYKQLYDSIKPTCIRSKEKCDTFVNQLNQKSIEISNLNASLQKNLVSALKNELRKLKGKDLADNVVTKNIIAPEMFKIDVEPIALKLLNNRTAHCDYHRHTQEQAAILREVVKQGKSKNPPNNSLDSAFKYTK